MTLHDDGPYLGASFRVRITGTPSVRRTTGLPVTRVEWGPFPVARGDVSSTPALVNAGDGLPARHVLLCRTVTGATDLADWWRAERAPKRSAARTVVVELTDPGSAAPVMTWTFRGCRVVQLSHSPLDAVAPTIVTESLVFEFAEIDIT